MPTIYIMFFFFLFNLILEKLLFVHIDLGSFPSYGKIKISNT